MANTSIPRIPCIDAIKLLQCMINDPGVYPFLFSLKKTLCKTPSVGSYSTCDKKNI